MMTPKAMSAMNHFRHVFTCKLYLDRDNAEGCTVKDSCGQIVFDVEYNFPDELNSSQREDIIKQTRAVAHLLLSLFS